MERELNLLAIELFQTFARFEYALKAAGFDHGDGDAKFNGRWFEPERSEVLLRYALVILQACLNASNDVRQAYHG